MIHFTLYSRSYCHLCDDMLEQLNHLYQKDLFTVEVIDVDLDEALVEKYDELVPVLIGKKDAEEAVQLCHYFLDIPKIQNFLHLPS